MRSDEFRALRIKKRYTQAQLAQALGRSGVTISFYERGVVRISDDIAKRLEYLPPCTERAKQGRPKAFRRPASNKWALGAWTMAPIEPRHTAHGHDKASLHDTWQDVWPWADLVPIGEPYEDHEQKILWVNAEPA